MITYQQAKEKHIKELAMLRGMFLSELNKDPKNKNDFVNSNLIYLKDAIPRQEFVAWIAIEKERIIGTSGIVFYNIAPCKSSPNGKVAYNRQYSISSPNIFETVQPFALASSIVLANSSLAIPFRRYSFNVYMFCIMINLFNSKEIGQI